MTRTLSSPLTRRCFLLTRSGTYVPYLTVVTLSEPVIDAVAQQFGSEMVFLFSNGTVGATSCGPDNCLNNPSTLNYSIVRPLLHGSQPPPLQLMDDGVYVERIIVRWAYDQSYTWACTLLSNQTLLCATNSDAMRAIVDNAPTLDGDTVIQMSAGAAHACMLFHTGNVTCWGSQETCLDGRCTPPPAVLFSSIECGAVATCGITQDGFIRCFGSSLTSTALLSTPSGVFGQIAMQVSEHCHAADDTTDTC